MASLLAALAAAAWGVDAGDATLGCRLEGAAGRLECEYRLARPLSDARVRLGGLVLPEPEIRPVPDPVQGASGWIFVDLSALLEAGITGTVELDVELRSEDGQVRFPVVLSMAGSGAPAELVDFSFGAGPSAPRTGTPDGMRERGAAPGTPPAPHPATGWRALPAAPGMALFAALGGVAVIAWAGALGWRRRASRRRSAAARGAVLEAGDGSGEIYPLTADRVRIGRSADNEIQLLEASISRHHAEIHRERDGAFVVTDLDSLNGVVVNGRRLKTGTIRPGDTVEFGDVSLRFALRTATEDPDSPVAPGSR